MNAMQHSTAIADLLSDEALYKAYAMEPGITGAEFDRRAKLIQAAKEASLYLAGVALATDSQRNKPT